MSELPAPSSSPSALAVLGGLSAPVSQGTYLAVGASLMAMKYAVEAGIVFASTGGFLTPWVYLSPLMSMRDGLLVGAPPWLAVAMLLWSLPFAWIGGTMSIRRARDAGLHPAVGLLFFVPFVNFLAMATLAALPTRERPPAPGPLQGPDREIAAALVGAAGGAGAAVAMTTLSTMAFGAYGAGLFIGTPFVMGAVAGLLYNLRTEHTLARTAGVGVLTTAVAGGFLLLLALEGVICLAMAAPWVILLGVLGALTGRHMARLEAKRSLAAPMVALPLLIAVEPPLEAPIREVTTSVVIAAPQQAVWDAVVAYPEIRAEPGWPFSFGVAFPRGARIEESGDHRVRLCAFSTGDVIGDVTVWDPPHELTFDIRALPPTMTELSPWSTVHAAHLDGQVVTGDHVTLRVEALADGRSRLTGTTAYRFDMAPLAYWGLWGDLLIGKMHQRVFHDVVERTEGR